ncbi:MAG: PD-(D/E)XK nuclease family protein, partial [Eubacteriales bacterium]|nr:PD-(D/E)XK nuclease family protein [Eubacteriales bacterium]
MPARVHFLLGRSGAGKTAAITAALKKTTAEGRRAVLIVPEQYTYETERTLARAMGGLLGVQVLSFTRLTERALQGDGRTYLSRQGRCMLIRRAAFRLQKQLTAFAPVAGTPGFAARMDELIALCKRFLLTPEALREAAFQLPEENALRNKLLDIALLYGAVEEDSKSRYLDAEDAMTALLHALPQSALAGAQVFVDGFDLLTAQLYAILDGLLEVAKTVTFSICIDPAGTADRAVFLPEERAYARLREMAAARNCPITMTELFVQPGVRAPALAFLEKNQFVWPVPQFSADAEEIHITAASDRTAEVEAMADAVCRLVRLGIRYREIAVVAGDMPSYLDLIRRAFSRRDIPLFMDVQHPLSAHPAAELMLCAVRAASRGLPAGELLRVIKTGLAGVSEDETEQFENYVLRYGLRGGGQFDKPFTKGHVPPEAESCRAAVVPPLTRLREGLQQPAAADKVQAVYGYLEELGVFMQLAATAAELQAEGRAALMQEHTQVAGVIVTLLEQLYAILGDTAMRPSEFTAILEEAVQAYQVGVIPATADQVLLGTLTRSRSRYVKALFVVGANEGVLPAAHADDGMIDDGELATLAGLGLTPWGNSERRAENDRLDLYRALSKATEELYVSYAYTSGSSELFPSPLVTRLLALFPNCSQRTCLSGNGEEAVLPSDAKSGLRAYARELRAKTPTALLTSLSRYYKNDPENGEKANMILRYRNAPIAPPSFGAALSRRLYGDALVTSVSRLESFNRCPFLHFMRYGLAAKPRYEYKEQATDLGSFCHLLLERFVTAVMERGNRWDTLTDGEIDDILNELYPACAAAYNSGMLTDSPRMQRLSEFWLERARATAHAVAAQIKAGQFLPASAELRFGEGRSVPALRLTLADGNTASLEGVIDRVDVAKVNGELLLRVVDYKTGAAALEFSDLADGTRLQLPLYLTAAREQYPKAAPAGLFYQPVDDPVLDEGEDAIKRLRELRLTGYLNENETAV